MSCSCDKELILLSSSLAIAIGENLSEEDLNLLSAFFMSLADNLSIIAACKNNN